MKELTLSATVENIEVVTDFVNEQLGALGCPMKAETQIDIAIDEIFSNIVYYAYNSEKGQVTVRFEVSGEPPTVTITFIDSGVPYDPLQNADPDTTISIEDRRNGGFGIYMVKKFMNDVTYAYRDGQNVLTIKKNLY